jgi:hypothetical protein
LSNSVIAIRDHSAEQAWLPLEKSVRSPVKKS